MYEIFTDTAANLDCSLLEELGVELIPFSFYYNGEEHRVTSLEQFDGHAYYDMIRAGTDVTTSLVEPQRYIDGFTPLLREGRDILFVGMSSGISGSYASAEVAAATLREEFPERKIRLVDTLSASLGEGLQVLKAVEYRAEGVDIDTAADRLLEGRHNMCQVFTVDNLKYLKKGGRISNLKAAVGTVLQIKPLLKGDPEGKIVCFAQVRGRKKSIELMAEQYDRYVEHAECETIGIAHGDCPEDAEALIALLNRNHPPKNIINACYEPMTGAHVGPGACAVLLRKKGIPAGDEIRYSEEKYIILNYRIIFR